MQQAVANLDEPPLAARNALIEENLDWARGVAKSVFMRLRVTTFDWADYVQAATVGLIEAADRFKPELGVPFQAYAVRRVRGEVFNSLRTLARDSRKTTNYDALVDRAEFLDDADLDPIERIVQLVAGLGAGIRLAAESLPIDVATPCTAYGAAEQQQLRRVLSSALDQLPERDRFVISMHYLHHVPFIEIAQTLQLTKGRISQLHRRAISQLRDALRRAGKAR